MATLELSPTVFSILSGLIEERAGLHYGLLDRELLQEKASARALEVGFDSLLDYYYFLRYDPGGELEFSALIEALVVGETYFFREWPAVEVIVNSFISPWCATGRRLRVWSAACATGEEPLSLAMLLDDRNLLNQVEIIATDISSKALTRAQRGRYGRRSIRSVPDQRLIDRYLHTEGNEFVVNPDLVSAIRWERLNLLSEEYPVQIGLFDLIMCRNVLIYFSDQTVKSVLNRLSRSLVQNGVLLVGVSESLLRYGSSLTGEERGGAFVYRKAA